MILNDIIETRAVIEEYLDYDLNINTAYKFTKFLLETENDYNFFIEKTKEIIEKYAKRDENNQIITNDAGFSIQEDKIEIAEKELINLSLIDINIGNYFCFNMSELEGLKISCRKLRTFIPFIQEV